MTTDRFSRQRVLVTGATGFLGSHVCRRLSASASELHAIARNQRRGGDSAARWWQGDLTDAATVERLLTAIKPDVIFHLASHGVGAPDLDHVLPTLQGDLVTTVNVLTAATRLGLARLVLAVSLEEPYPNRGDAPLSSPYAAAKWACTAYARMFHDLYRAPIVAVRPFMTYGPGQRSHKLIPYVTLALLQGEAPKLTSGTRPVDWIYVDDVIDGLLIAAQAPGVEGCTIDLGSGVLVPIRDVVERLVRLVGARVQPLFGALNDRPSEQVRVADTADAYARLGWKPVTSLEEGLTRTVAWYRQQLAAGATGILSARLLTTTPPVNREESLR